MIKIKSTLVLPFLKITFLMAKIILNECEVILLIFLLLSTILDIYVLNIFFGFGNKKYINIYI